MPKNDHADDRFERLQSLFQQARELPVTERHAFLSQACDDRALKCEVESLLANDREGDSWVPAVPAVTTDPDLTLPDRIGEYRIVGILGEGGMGRVYLAEQQGPVTRRVALKVVKLGMDSQAVVARFALERQALARMNHDAIARVYDCGTTERGQPFFAMELVEGEPVTSYCDRHRLSLRERIELFDQVCLGVEHAHQKGIVHRDLKPGNLLAARIDERHVVKIIDFGIARATDQQFVGDTMFTKQGALIGTPDYMSPEQADPAGRDIDTRTDVYSLGVVLYELLCGERPFSSVHLREAGMLEVQRILREVEPPRPSIRVRTGDLAGVEVARARRTVSRSLRRALRNDLDWVVLKALEKDRNRRYETASALAADLRRFLAHEPLAAGPPTAGYRLKKLLRRHRGQATAAAAVLLTALIGGAFALGYAVKAGGYLAWFALPARFQNAVAAAQQLFPDWPHRVADLEAWLDDSRELLTWRRELESPIADLRTTARPWTDEQRRRDLEGHARYREWVTLGDWLASLRRAQAIQNHDEALVLPALTPSQLATDAAQLNTFAYHRVAPPPAYGEAGGRVVFGEEALALAVAREAARHCEGRSDAHRIQDTLAWALLYNGQHDDARQASAAAQERAPAAELGRYRSFRARLEYAIDHAAELLRQTEAAYAALTAEVTRRRTWQIDRRNEQFLHDTLTGLFDGLTVLEHERMPDVARRLTWARQVGALTRAHPNARVTWAEVRAAIASSPRYAGMAIVLRDEDVIGLVPIGENPKTGYQEFYHLRSAWDGVRDPSTLAIPQHVADGTIAVGDDTGMVFVLLPGGTFRMGATLDPDDPNYDPQAQLDEAPRDIPLAPFLLARHELTQGQWRRLWSGDENLRLLSGHAAGADDRNGGRITWAHPVESMDWFMADTLLRQHMLLLPTEAQWEYGCRADTSGPFGCAPDELRRYANVADATSATVEAWLHESWADGYVVHAPVGSFLANAFGLHDMHGNVWEWCRDQSSPYEVPVAEGDGLLLSGNVSGEYSTRGGGFDFLSSDARAAMRDGRAPTMRKSTVGLRAARALRPGR